MNVKEFVQSVLVQIAEGVQAANNEFAANKLTARANPPGANSECNGGTHYLPVSDTHEVSFSIAIAVDMAGASDANGCLVVVPGGITGASQFGTTTSNVSRVEFRVPLKLPRPQRIP